MIWQNDEAPLWDLDSSGEPMEPAPFEPEERDTVVPSPGTVRRTVESLPTGHHVVLFALDPPGFCGGRIASVDDSSLRVSLDHEPDRLQLWPLSVCLIAFLHQGETHAFLSRVWGFGSDEGVRRRPVVILSKPDQQMTMDWRSAPRVVVPDDAGFACVFRVGATGKWPCRLCNLSVSGALIEFDPSRMPELQCGSEAELEILWEDMHCRLLAVICRRQGNEYAVMFPESLSLDEIRPPMHLETMVRDLQELWLRRRAA
ncbi:MAG: hypothetical protein C4341_03545 [Armatimonadota bacterium]